MCKLGVHAGHTCFYSNFPSNCSKVELLVAATSLEGGRVAVDVLGIPPFREQGIADCAAVKISIHEVVLVNTQLSGLQMDLTKRASRP